MYSVPLVNYPAISPDKLALELPNYSIYYSGDVAEVSGAVINETEILTAFANHVPNEVPYFLYRVVAATNGPLMEHIGNGIKYIESTGNFKRLYFDPIPVTATVDGLIGTYVEPVAIQNINIIKYANKTIFETDTETDFFTALQPEEIAVSKNSASFSTIEAAINYVNTLANKKVLIKIYPGTYYENNPLILPNYVCLRGQGSGGNTTIIGVNAAAVFVTGEFSCIRDVAIAGGTVAVQHDGSNTDSFALIKDSLISMTPDGVAVLASGGLGSMVLSHVSIVASAAGTGTAIVVNGGSVIASETIIQAPVAKGISFTGGVGTLNTFSVYYCAVALEALNTATIKCTLLNIISCAKGIYFPVNTVAGDQTVFGAAYLSITGSTTDIDMQEPCAVNLFGSVVDLDKVVNNTASEIGGVMMKNDGDHRDVVLSGDFSINGSVDFAVRKCSMNYWTTYAGCTDAVYSFSTATAIGTIEYWNGTAWTVVQFMQEGKFYWLDLNITQTQTTVNSILGYWLKFDVAITNMEAYEDTSMITGANRYYIGRARKKNRIYFPSTSGTVYFYRPVDADLSTVYTIRASATVTGITVDGNYIAGTTVSATKRFTGADIQSFSVSAVNLTIICVEYYMYKF
jgi:hypothetical protein